MSIGFVALIGAGPGRAEYLTLAAIRALETSDVILYDALLDSDIKKLFPPRSRAIYVGKRCGKHSLTQEQIHEKLLTFAKKGLRVARLKGGDPFIFGRGFEEVLVLRQENIPYQVIPGVSALNGIAATMGLPLTSRDHDNEFRVIQGHHLPDTIDHWQSLAHYRGTLVIFMGLNRWDEILHQLLKNGADPNLAVAIIESRHDWDTIATLGTLKSFQEHTFVKKSHGPGIIYIGKNVQLIDHVKNPAIKETCDDLSFAHIS